MALISSNTFFHFTRLECLIGILENNFYPKYCIEYTCDSNGTDIKMAYPMVCFCDIPLSQISNHIDNYGHYGLGLSREWVLRNKLNPIIYLQKQSILFQRFENILSSNWDTINSIPIKQVFEDRDALIYLMMHTKPYEGFQMRNDIKKQIRFYDEREWRYIPNITRIDGEELHLISDKYTTQQIDIKNNFLKQFPLVFEPKDIMYIIIKNEKERSNIINKVVSIKSSKSYNNDDIKLLTSKIISVEQIISDF